MNQEEPTIHQKPKAIWGGPTIRINPQEVAEFAAKYPSLQEQFEVLAQVGEHRVLGPFSQQQLRIAYLAQECLRTGYTERLTRAISDYLTEAGSLEQLDQPWPEAGENKKDVLEPLMTSGYYFQPRDLDALDLRILDICLHQHQLASFLRAYAGNKERRHTRLQHICDYLQRREVDVQTFLNLLADEHYVNFFQWASDGQGNLTPLGDLIRRALPAHLERFDEVAETHHHRTSLIQLLLAGPSPMLDLAWDIAERDGQRYSYDGLHQPRGPAYYYWALGEHMARLLKDNPAQFIPLARHLAGPESPAYPKDPWWPSPREQFGRFAALQALLAQDPAAHMDLAVEAVRAPFDPWGLAGLQQVGLTAAYAFDPVRYFPLVEEAALSANQHLGELAVEILSGASFEQALPSLQRCVAQGHPAARLKALKVLLSQPWEGQAGCARTLVSDRFQPIRTLATRWLRKHAEPITEHVVPDAAMVDTSWQRIETWLAAHAPDVLDRLSPGATDEELRVLEAILGFRLPEALTAFLQRHNGTAGALVHYWEFLSTSGIAQTWQMWIDLDRRNKHRLQEINEQFEGYEAWHQAHTVENLSEEDRWNSEWIPLAGNGRGDVLCLDLTGGSFYGAPLTEGQSGQVFEFIHDDTVNPWRAPSLADLWSDLAGDLEAGKYALDEFGGLQSEDAPI